MVDGHLNKCKECTKNDSRKNHERKSKDEFWMESERIRSREKFHKLNYKDKYPNNTSNIYRNLHRNLKFRKGRKFSSLFIC